MIHLTMANTISNCPINCVCFVTKIECNKTLPSFIPENVTSVTALEIPLEPYMNFTYTDWYRVTYLSVSLGNGKEKKTLRQLKDFEFLGLLNLQHLKLPCHCQLSVTINAFHGLTNVTVLDLSNNKVNSLNLAILPGLNGHNILPNLSKLYLSSITSSRSPVLYLYLNLYDLHTAMENKPLKILDFSGTNLILNSLPFQNHTLPLLPQVHSLNLSNAGPAVFSLTMVYQYYKQRPESVFSNLQMLDASYPNFPRSQLQCQRSYDYYKQFCRTVPLPANFLPSNLTELHIKNIFASQIHDLRGSFNVSHLCITTECFSKSKTICVGENFELLTKLDVSDNAFTYIQPQLLQALTSLIYFDARSNILGQALADRTYAVPFFHALKNAEVLLFSKNNITFLPNVMLRSNMKARHLDLSYNKLTSVNFGIKYLSELRILDLSHNRLTSVTSDINKQALLDLLDLSFNRIVSVDSADCGILKNIQFSSNISTNNMSHNNKRTELRLEGNPLSCTCDNLCLFNYLQDQNNTFNCTSNGKTQNVDFLFTKHFDYSCKKGIVIAAFTFFSIILLVFTVWFIVSKERQQIIHKRLKERGLEQYSTSRKKYVVFLSFSGDDSEFVMTKVYPQLEAELKLILNTESDCVATGGTHFRPGHAIKDEILRCVEESSVVIFFLSDTFINKSWCTLRYTRLSVMRSQ